MSSKLSTKPSDYRSRYEEESKRISSLGLVRSPENEYNKELGLFVPRSRLIGSDGIVRAMRVANQEPFTRPKNSTYMKMTRAFTKLRRMGVDARWNIMVPESDTYTGYWCSLPDYVGPRATHWRAADVVNSSISTGLQWTHDWEPVQDAIDFDCINGAEKYLIDILAEQDIRSEVNGEFDHSVSVEVIFRGDGGACKAMWSWINYAISENKVEAPEIGSFVTDVRPYLEM
jgi:hypothetical protein